QGADDRSALRAAKSGAAEGSRRMGEQLENASSAGMGVSDAFGSSVPGGGLDSASASGRCSRVSGSTGLHDSLVQPSKRRATSTMSTRGRSGGAATVLLVLVALLAAPAALARDAAGGERAAHLTPLARVSVVGSGPIAWANVAVRS